MSRWRPRHLPTLVVLGLVPMLIGSPQVRQSLSAPESPAASSIGPTALRVEYLTDPLAVHIREPRVSWQLSSKGSRGARQTAYQVIVSTTRAQLNARRGDLWDSGQVSSDLTTHVAYAGTPLRSRQHVFWAVRVWDEKGRASTWSEPAEWTMGLLDAGDWTAQWIGDPGPSAGDVSATMLRRAFSLGAAPRRALLYSSAFGLYEIHINGTRVGDHQLAPEWTDYTTRVQYQAYDVTSLLKPGDNAIGAYLADGWYAGRLGLAERLVNKRRSIYGDHPRLLVQLEIQGASETTRIVTDSAWRTSRGGPIRSADLLDGEEYDARREMSGWSGSEFDDRTWTPADVAANTRVHLVPQPNEPIRVTGDVAPVALREPKPGVYVFDLGQNIAGWVRVHVRGPAGTTVTIRHAEMLNDDGTIYTANLRSAKATDRYTLKGVGDEVYEPRFTYHGFRYVELTGLGAKPAVGDLTGRVVHSDVPKASSFESSDDLLNALFRNIVWTQRDNLHSVPTDCPQRDERLGWMGDILIFAQTGIFNFDMAAFLTKWLQDVRDAQAENGRFADFSPHPFGKNESFTGAPGWGDAGVVVPWLAYVNYGDTRLLADHYEAATRWIEFIRRENPALLWKQARGNDYGDWLNGDTLVHEGWPRRGAQIPKEVFATAVFAYSTDLLARIAHVLGRDDDARKYAALFEDIKKAFNAAYVSADGTVKGNTQSSYALPLYFNLLPDAARPQAVRRMIEGLDRYNGHMSTGFHSTYRMMLELTRAGRNDLAYDLAVDRTFPSWGYTIDNGATTIWERWDGYVRGRGFQDASMNSFNHYAIGAVGEWMFRVIVGINPDETQPGFRHVVIRPRPVPELDWARGTYASIRGPISVEWRQAGPSLDVEVTIPPNVRATVHIPTPDITRVTEHGKPVRHSEGLSLVGMADGAAVFEAGSGNYEFAVR
jgi:alpha-L-rhamnosidase